MQPDMRSQSAVAAQPGPVAAPGAASDAAERAVFTTSRKRRAGPPTARAA